MNAILRKEMRVNAKWGLLAMLAVSAGLTFIAYASSHPSPQPILVIDRMEMTTGFGFPAIGLALGMLIVLQDYGTGRWALLTHRPISRGRIFLGKLFAASLLYLVATALPLTALTIWVALRGNEVAPFDWHMALPRFAHLFGGLSWLMAGMLVAARRARWIGSRVFPVGIVLIASAAAEALSTHLWHALIIPLAAIVALTPAARGAFVAGGEYESQPWFARLCQVVCVVPGVALVMFAITGLLTSAIDMMKTTGPTPYSYDYYMLDNEGHVVNLANGVPSPAMDASRVVALYRAPIDQNVNIQTSRFFSSDAYAELVGTSAGEILYYMPQRRTIEVREPAQRRYAGSFGPRGFVNSTLPAEPFPDPISVAETGGLPGWAVIFSRKAVWRLTPGDGAAVKRIFQAPESDPVLSAAAEPASDDSPPGHVAPGEHLIAVLTRSSVHLIQSDREIGRLPVEPDVQNGSLSIAHPSERRFVLLYSFMFGQQTSRLITVDDWKVTDRRLLHRTSPPISNSPRLDALEEAVEAAAMPPPMLAVSRWDDRSSRWLGVWGAIAAGLLTAIVSRLLMCRYVSTTAGRWVWTVIGFLLGMSGILLLICTRQAVARVNCWKCGRLRSVARDRCERCQAEFKPPTRLGIEVFEPAGAWRELVEAAPCFSDGTTGDPGKD